MARQPIFDRRGDLVAYELLYRSGLINAVPSGVNLDAASAQVISDALTVFGYETLLDHRTGYINASERVLLEGWYRVLPADRTVVEVLETVSPTDAVFAACQVAKLSGYRVALDDFVYRPELQRLLNLADVVKIDFLQTPPEARIQARRRIGAKALAVAEKVETSEDFRAAVAAGFDLFQGYFFARPEIIARKDISPGKLALVELLKELNRPELDFPRVEQAIKHDPALSLKLLRFLNSAAFGWRSRVETLKQALVLLGERPFRRWATLVAVSTLASEGTLPLLMTCMVRARFAELLAQACLVDSALDAFFAGILSALDAVVGRPLPELLNELGLSQEIRAALLGTGEGPFANLLALVMGYEQGQWAEVSAKAIKLRLPETLVGQSYQEAVAWSHKAWSETA